MGSSEMPFCLFCQTQTPVSDRFFFIQQSLSALDSLPHRIKQSGQHGHKADDWNPMNGIVGLSVVVSGDAWYI